MSLMHTNPSLFWGLITSVITVLIMGFTTCAILFIKAKKMRNKLVLTQIDKDKKDVGLEMVFKQGSNELVWALKEDFKNPMDNISLEYILTTAIRNQYKKIWFEGETTGYELLTLALKTKANIFILKENIIDQNHFEKMVTKYKINKSRISLVNKKGVKDKYDYAILSESTTDYNATFDNVWANIKVGGIVMITKCKRLNTSQKQLIRYLKLIDARFEHQKINDGFIIIAK